MTNHPDEQFQAFEASRIDEELGALELGQPANEQLDPCLEEKQRLLADLRQLYQGQAKQQQSDLGEIWQRIASSTSYARYQRWVYGKNSARKETRMQQETIPTRSGSPEKQPQPPRRRSRWISFLGSVAAVLCVAIIVGSLLLVLQATRGGSLVGGSGKKTATPTIIVPTPTLPTNVPGPRGTLLYKNTDQDANAIRVVSWDSEGRYLLTTGTNIKIWDTSRKLPPKTHPAPELANIFYAAWSPDSKMYALALGNLTIRSATGVQICQSTPFMTSVSGPSKVLSTYQPVGFTSPLSMSSVPAAFSWSPDGKYIAVSTLGSSNLLTVYNTQCQRVWTYGDSEAGYIFDAQWSHDGQRLAWSGQNGIVRLYDYQHKKVLQTLTVPGHMIERVRWSPDDRYVATMETDSTQVQIWDTQTGARVATYTSPAGNMDLAWSPDGAYLAIVSHSKYNEKNVGTLKIWDRGIDRVVYTYNTTFWLDAVAWSPDGQKIALGGEIFDPNEGLPGFKKDAPVQVVQF